MDIELAEINIDVARHKANIRGPAFWTFAASEWHRLYRPYVPFKEGVLYGSVNISGGNSEGVIEHTAPYAHYAYEGEVYGPNVPIMQAGQAVGFFSPEAPKHPTGRMMHYSGKGSRHWDEAAAPTQLPKLLQSLQSALDSGRFDV